MSPPVAPFNIKSAKISLSKQLTTLETLLQDTNDFRSPWNYPTELTDLKIYISTNKLKVTTLKQQLEEKANKIIAYYEQCLKAIVTEDPTREQEFDQYWEERKGDQILAFASNILQQLDKRLTELECQELAMNLSHNEPITNSNITALPPQMHTQDSILHPLNSLTLEQRLLSSELKVPEFHGNPTEFGPFWELFEELVHKQPYSNIGKLSILLSCCKGDAARSLKMIPRTGDSYDRAVQQLKSQYEDPKRITIQMIRQLKSMKACHDDPRTLRNNLSDIQAIIATMQKQGEAVDSTYMTTMVIETFPKNVQEEIARKEFDNGTQWTMDDLINNLATIVKRKEHIESRNDHLREHHSVFFTRAREYPIISCIGCGQAHKFEVCDKYHTVYQKIDRLKSLSACWKCFSPRHRTAFCQKSGCIHCGGHHNPIICLRKSTPRRVPGRQLSPYRVYRKNSQYTPIPRNQLYRSHYTPPRASPVHYTSNTTKSLPLPNTSQRNRSPRSTSPHPRNNTSASQSNKQTTASSIRHSPRTSPYRVRFAPLPDTTQTPANTRSTSPHQPERITTLFSNSHNISTIRLMIVHLTATNGYTHQSENVYALLDSASDRSFISASLAKRLQLTPHSETTIVMHTFGGYTDEKHVQSVESMLLNSQGKPLKVSLITNTTLTHPITLTELQQEDKQFLQDNYPDFQELWLSDTINVTPDILLGIDYFNSILLPSETSVQLPSGLFITPTFFGPVISGRSRNISVPTSSRTLCTNTVNVYTIDSFYEPIGTDYSHLWTLPGVGIDELDTNEEINRHIIEDFYSTVRLHEGNIYVRFPWKNNKHCLADNYHLALSRLHQLCNMKTKNPQCWKDYCDIIDDQLRKGFIEDAPGIPTHENPYITYHTKHEDRDIKCYH